MKTPIYTAAALLTCSTAMSASSAVILGWEVWGSSTPAPTVVNGDATGSAARSGTWITTGNPAQGASNDGTFGTLPGASTATGSGTGIFVRSGTGSFSFTITAGAQDVELDSFNFDSIRERAGSPEFYEVEVLAGSAITVGSVASGNQGAQSGSNGPQDLKDYDIDLTGLADRTVEAGQSATIRINFSGGTGASNQDTHLDNVAFNGTFVPEPTSLALMGLGGLLVARRRR